MMSSVVWAHLVLLILPRGERFAAYPYFAGS
jgi:hypothetical protein